VLSIRGINPAYRDVPRTMVPDTKMFYSLVLSFLVLGVLYVCHDCKLTFSSRKTLYRHRKSHQQQPPRNGLLDAPSPGTNINLTMSMEGPDDAVGVVEQPPCSSR
jgi:hypothetical protein